MENIITIFENNIQKISSLKKLSGGLSNDIYLINESFIWKVIKNKYLFDHQNEIDIMKNSSSFSIYYHDDFNICYNFINGNNISLIDYKNNLDLVINKTKQYHEINVNTCNFWNEIIPKWLKQIKEDSNIIRIYNEISKEIDKINDINDLVLCHHDIHSANIIKNLDGYNLIDLEFSFTNYYYADLGNIICEYFTDYNKEIYNYDKIDDNIKLKVINLYFSDNYKTLKECPLILQKINIGIKMSHFYWFLWGKLVAKNESCKEFNYLGFSNHRFKYLN